MGTVFRLTPDGALSTVATFNGTSGASPLGHLIADRSGNLLGTTFNGGASDLGTVFRVSPAGTVTTLATFNSTNGDGPCAGLISDSAGNLFGTTQYGGTSDEGTVFKLHLNGTVQSLVSFNISNGRRPRGALLADAAGNLYGTTSTGGLIAGAAPYGDGTVFKIASNGTFSTLAKFTSSTGWLPQAALVADDAGNLYGTTEGYRGTVFKVTPGGTLTVRSAFFNGFDSGADFIGSGPDGPLLLDAAGNLFGVTHSGGQYDDGTIFRLAPDGTLTTIISFDGLHGRGSFTQLLADATGNLYGTTVAGGPNDLGTIFKVSNSGFVVVPEPATFIAIAGTSTFALRRRRLRVRVAYDINSESLSV